MTKRNCCLLCGLCMYVLCLQSSRTSAIQFSGTVKDSHFFSRRLSTFPTKRITIKFSVLLHKSITPDIEKNQIFPLIKFYTMDTDVDLKLKCISRGYGQLFNQEMVIPIKPKPFKYVTVCGYSSRSTKSILCTGNMKIEDFMPRNYSVSFGYECSRGEDMRIRNLSYKISTSGQSNQSVCMKRSTPFSERIPAECFPHYASPNLFGHQSAAVAIRHWKTVNRFLSPPTCHQNLRKSLCYLFYPSCDPGSHQTKHLCKEMCQDIFRACWDVTFTQHQATLNLFLPIDRNFFNISLALGYCEYLPSIKSDESSCYYEPARCESLPTIPNANLANATQQRITSDVTSDLDLDKIKKSCTDGSCYTPASYTNQMNNSLLAKRLRFYPVHSTTVFSCVNDNFYLKGSKNVTCLYSGEWSELPVCATKVSSLSPILIIIPLFLFPSFLFVAYILWLRWRKRKKPLKQRRRNKQCDALVSCNFGHDAFVAETLIPNFEENQNPPFRLNYHERDFYLGVRILDNIQDAVENSNSAIFLICQRFIDSI